MTPSEKKEPKVCTKCGKEPRADQSEDATNRHCNTCKTTAARARTAAMLEQQQGKGYGKGVAAMRELMADKFEDQGVGYFNGFEIAEMIRRDPGPLPGEKSEDGDQTAA